MWWSGNATYVAAGVLAPAVFSMPGSLGHERDQGRQKAHDSGRKVEHVDNQLHWAPPPLLKGQEALPTSQAGAGPPAAYDASNWTLQNPRVVSGRDLGFHRMKSE